ncbi:MAG: hypothetical protein IKA57_03290, partial [Clostridia bacterium]|nr:hypothetical protein [Clostridia bacterium]
DIDYENNNVANAELDTNLSAYNYAEKILINGQTLAEFGQTHSYKLIANKRTRPDTISIDFDAGVLNAVETVEILAGCQLPTLSYAYRNLQESSCLEISQGKKYMRLGGVWVDYFEGYSEGIEYKGTDSSFKLHLEETFKGHAATPLNGYTDVFMKYDVQGEKLDHKILVSGSNTVKDNLMVLDFVHPIDAKQFAKINLRVYINHAVELSTYNANDVTAAALGTPLESFSVSGGMFSYLSLTSAFYEDDDGMVDMVVFRFDEDCQMQFGPNGEELKDGSGRLIRDTFHFVSFNVANPDIVTKDSFTVKDLGESYSATFRFNKLGEIENNATLDLSKVTLNGQSLSTIKQECSAMTAEWIAVKGVYQISVSLPKTYQGVARIKNPQYNFANNHMGVEAGLVFPNGDVLSKSYACHLYSGEKILDTNMVGELTATQVQYIRYSFDEGSNNLRFTLYFDKNITSVPYYHACETEHWRANDLYKSDNTLYDGSIAQIFVDGGYKSSLLNSILINGKTIGEWHAHDSGKLTNVQTHYGNSGLNCVDVIFEKLSPDTYDTLYAFVESGEGIVIEIKSGLKFMVNLETKNTQTFVLAKGSFQEKVEKSDIKVYYDGIHVAYGDLIRVQTVASEKCIAIQGIGEYSVSSAKDGETTTYTITYGEDETFTFAVQEEIVVMEEQGGCNGSILGLNGILLAVALAVVGKKHRARIEEQDTK